MIEDIQSLPHIPANRHGAIKRIADYMSMMEYAGKPVTHVVLFAGDYDAIFKAAQKHSKAHKSAGRNWPALWGRPSQSRGKEMSYDPMVANASPKELVRMVLADNDASERELRLAKIIGDKFDAMAEEARIAESHAEQMEEEKEGAERRAEEFEGIAKALKDSLEDALPFVEAAGESALVEKIKDRLSRADREL